MNTGSRGPVYLPVKSMSCPSHRLGGMSHSTPGLRRDSYRWHTPDTAAALRRSEPPLMSIELYGCRYDDMCVQLCACMHIYARTSSLHLRQPRLFCREEIHACVWVGAYMHMCPNMHICTNIQTCIFIITKQTLKNKNLIRGGVVGSLHWKPESCVLYRRPRFMETKWII